jgi:hypothetical protein
LPLGKVYEVVAENNEKFGSQVINAMEVTKGAFLDKGFSKDFESVCSVSIKKSNSWEKSISFRNIKYPLGGNPALAIADGVIYAVCMSVDLNYNGGSLELLISRDNGVNWDIRTVVEIEKEGIPDRPSIATGEQGDIYLSYSHIDVEYNSGDISKIKAHGKILKSVDVGKTFSDIHFAPFQKEKDCANLIICGENTISLGVLNNELIVAWGNYQGNLYSSIYKGDKRLNVIDYGNYGFTPALIDVKIDKHSNKYAISLFQAHEHSYACGNPA